MNQKKVSFLFFKWTIFMVFCVFFFFLLVCFFHQVANMSGRAEFKSLTGVYGGLFGLNVFLLAKLALSRM